MLVYKYLTFFLYEDILSYSNIKVLCNSSNRNAKELGFLTFHLLLGYLKELFWIRLILFHFFIVLICQKSLVIIYSYLQQKNRFFLALQNVLKDWHTSYRMKLKVSIQCEYAFSKTEPPD